VNAEASRRSMLFFELRSLLTVLTYRLRSPNLKCAAKIPRRASCAVLASSKARINKGPSNERYMLAFKRKYMHCSLSSSSLPSPWIRSERSYATSYRSSSVEFGAMHYHLPQTRLMRQKSVPRPPSTFAHVIKEPLARALDQYRNVIHG
jgi:hypothetical protein